MTPESIPVAHSELAHQLMALMTRSAAMGLLAGPAVTVPDAAAVKRMVKGLQQHGIAKSARVSLSPLMRDNGPALGALESHRLQAELTQISAALEASAAPSAEWPAMRAVFGDDPLAGLLAVSPSSLRRYAAGERDTPQPIAERLHWLAMVVADLAGAYNDFGIRRWFERPRPQLAGRSPRAVLGENWLADGEAAQRVRQLAAVLSGAQALAV